MSKRIWEYELTEILNDYSLRAIIVKTYSDYYEGGRACRSCSSSIQMYYSKLKNTGMAREELLKLAKERTFKPNFSGLRWVAKLQMHIHTDYMHDKQAIEMLKAGALQESDFVKLPDGYSPAPAQEIELNIEQIEQETQQDIEQETESVIDTKEIESIILANEKTAKKSKRSKN